MNKKELCEGGKDKWPERKEDTKDSLVLGAKEVRILRREWSKELKQKKFIPEPTGFGKQEGIADGKQLV